jgi:hypothetical protein
MEMQSKNAQELRCLALKHIATILFDGLKCSTIVETVSIQSLFMNTTVEIIMHTIISTVVFMDSDCFYNCRAFKFLCIKFTFHNVTSTHFMHYRIAVDSFTNSRVFSSEDISTDHCCFNFGVTHTPLGL